MWPQLPNIPIQKINASLFDKKGVEVFIKREDLIHEHISGNKWRKLKYNLLEAKSRGAQTICTFGGAYSNHIAATAAAGKTFGIQTHGIIRGEKVLPLNPTLAFAQSCGMTFQFISRWDYKNRNELEFQKQMLQPLKSPFLIPEGGANIYGLKGCMEICVGTQDFDVLLCAMGTGNTFSGIVAGLSKHQKAIGIPVLKQDGFLEKKVLDNLQLLDSKNSNWSIYNDYHFGGYAKWNQALIDFIQFVYKTYQIKLDPIYTGKAFFGLWNLIEKGEVKDKKVLFIHTGGLQGVAGFESRFGIELFKD